MRVADWIAEYLHKNGVRRVHGLMGGGAAGLNDGFIKHPGIEYICYHHEQGAGHAAVGEAKYTGKLAVVNPTTGCGGTNCATSVLNAWQDGAPVLFLSGNVRLDNCTRWFKNKQDISIRHYGAQEHNIVDTMKSMTKAAYFIDSVALVSHGIQSAIHLATSGRPGPVWVDIPSNIQAADMGDHKQYEYPTNVRAFKDKDLVQEKLKSAKRPLIIAGNGIRQAGCIDAFMAFAQTYQIPFVTTYGAQDYAPYDHPLNVGPIGIRGCRAGNFSMQNADLILVLGSSLGSTVIGYDPAQFNPTAYKIYLDIENDELEKNIIPMDYTIHTSLQKFFAEML